MTGPFDRAALRSHLAGFAGVNDGEAVRVVLHTLLVFVVSLVAANRLLGGLFDALAESSGWAGLWALGATAGVVLLGLSQVRAFVVLHDVCHGALFSSGRTRALVAPLLGALCFTSPSVWKREHDRHHRDSNILDREQDGQTASWTVARYEAAAPWKRWGYFLLNQPPVLFGVLPLAYFLGFMRLKARLHEHVVLGLLLVTLGLTGLLPAFLLAMAPAACFGFLLFHAQHTFEGVYRRRLIDWDFYENGLYGSSVLTGPENRLVDWFLYGVGYHALHHLNPAIPGHRLRACLEANEGLFARVPRVTLGSALASRRFTLFDEATGELTTFKARPPWRTGQMPVVHRRGR